MIDAAATRAAALDAAARRLGAAGVAAPRREARLLMQHALKITREALLANDDRALAGGEARRFAALVRRRAAREPLAYLTGRCEFWSLDFAVDRSVLVPRPETETVVEAVLACAARFAPRPRLLDLGTGSGCLLLALLTELPGALGFGVDISPAAVSLARGNARRHGLDGRASFAVADWGAPICGRFDIVVSNPPYVATAALASLAPDIVRHEPRAALDGGADGYTRYRRLAPDAARLLAPEGVAAVELGAGMADGVAGLFAAAGLAEIGRRRDLAGIERCALFASAPPMYPNNYFQRRDNTNRRRKSQKEVANRAIPVRVRGLAKRSRLGGFVGFLSNRW